MDKHMITVLDLAIHWGITTRRVTQLCNAGEIKGAIKEKGRWWIPDDVEKPECLRSKRSLNDFYKPFRLSDYFSENEMKQYLAREATGMVKEDSASYHPSENTELISVKLKKKPKIAQRTTETLPLAIGQSLYSEVESLSYYVDKTLLIKEIIDSAGQVYLFTRPRRFGKTTALNMLKTYFEDAEEDTSVFFENRNIWKCGENYQKHQGIYPVIYLTFKDIHYRSWKDAYESFTYLIRSEYSRHRKILFNQSLSSTDIDFYRRIMDGSADEIDFQKALFVLSRLLFQHYKQKVIVLIDEYDTPVQTGYFEGFYEQVIAFMKNVFSQAFKDNPYLYKGVLTGVLRVTKDSLFSSLNNLVVNSVVDKNFGEYFGFTEDEVFTMLDYYQLTDKKDLLKHWYDGYLFGEHHIYNPWSIINCINNKGDLQPYWANTGSNREIGLILGRIPEDLQSDLIKLCRGETITATITNHIIYPQLEDSDDSIFSFLLVAGYLTISKVYMNYDSEAICELRIPNQEIKVVFNTEILRNLKQLLSPSISKRLRVALFTSNSELFVETIHEFLLQSASNYDTSSESFYHGMVLGMLSVVSDNYYVRSNREAGTGRFDIQLEPQKAALPGFLFEFKTKKDLEASELEKLAEKGLNQIKEKEYTVEMQSRSISPIHIYGVGFSGKKVAVKHEVVQNSI